MFLQQRHDAGGEHVHAEEAQVMAGPQPGHDQLLLGLGGRGLLAHHLDLVEVGAARHAPPAHRAVVRQHVLARGLHRRDGAVLGPGHPQQLLGAALGAGAEVEVVADHVQERRVAHERARAQQGVAVAARLALFDALQAAGMGARGLAVGGFVAGADDHGQRFDPRGQRLLDDDLERRFLHAIAVHQRMQRERALVGSGRGDDGAGDFPVLVRNRPWLHGQFL